MKYYKEEFNNTYLKYKKQLRLKKLSRVLDIEIPIDDFYIFRISEEIFEGMLRNINLEINIDLKTEILHRSLSYILKSKNVDNPFLYFLESIKRSIYNLTIDRTNININYNTIFYNI